MHCLFKKCKSANVDLLCAFKFFVDIVKLYSKKLTSIYILTKIYEEASFATHFPMVDIT